MTGVNTLFNALLNNKEFQQLDFLHRPSLCGRRCMPVQQAVAERWVKLTGQYLLEGYGLIGGAPLVSVNRDIDYHSGSIGLPVPSTEAKLAYDNDNEVAPGEPGRSCALKVHRSCWAIYALAF